MIQNDVSIAIICNDKNEILLQKKDINYKWFPGMWCLFGGKIEKDEAPEITLKRELLEELNIVANNIFFLFDNEYIDVCENSIRKGVQHVYNVSDKIDISQIKLNEGNGIAYISKVELNNFNIVDHDKKIIERYFQNDIK